MNQLRAVKIAVTILMVGLAATSTSSAQTFTSLHSFNVSDGFLLYAGLAQGTDGYLYGTTYAGGTGGYGTVYKISPTGTLTTLHVFLATEQNSDGAYPAGGLVQGTDGNFYGTTSLAGLYNEGTVFKMTPSGTLTTLYSFCALPSCADGTAPAYAALIQGVDGNFYGTTAGGGVSGKGTVFEITPTGKLTTLHSFAGTPDGQSPIAALIQGSDGALYGTTFVGGASGQGTVFKVTTTGMEKIVYSFCSQTNCSDGAAPEGGLLQAANGSLYGTTSGTIFQLTLAGKLTTLYELEGNATSSLVQGRNGNFYGTVLNGDEGIIEITPAGLVTILHSFDGTDGGNPYAGLIQDTNGTFYGTTLDGGTSNFCTYGCGTVFSISDGLGPFVTPRPTFGKVGAHIVILGTNLTGTSAVKFNGMPAIFTATDTAIQTTVPAGATNGEITVTTPNGTLSSNVFFRVRP